MYFQTIQRALIIIVATEEHGEYHNMELVVQTKTPCEMPVK